MEPRAFFVAIAGPTASGKSALGMALAERLDAEIISVDSAQVYRGMDIGTAKPGAEERARVPHHLIDIVEPTDAYSAAQFAADAAALIEAVHARGRVPVLVGGTMLYYKALLHGLDELPAADASVRAQIELEAERLGWPALHAQLAAVDPVTAARLAPNDAQRIERALEVFRSSGRPLSSFHTGARAGKSRLRARCLALVSLEPRERGMLHERIAQRFDAMLDQGFIDEVRALRARGDLRADLPAMRCVGYRQAWLMLDETGGEEPDAARRSALREQGIAATRQLAKRQLTWLRSLAERQVFALDDAQGPHAALEHVLRAVDAVAPS